MKLKTKLKQEKLQNKTDLQILLDLLDEMAIAKPVVYNYKNSSEVHIGFDGLKIFSDYQKVSFEDLVSAFNYYNSLKYKISDRSLKLKRIASHLEKELKRLTSRLNKLLVVIETGSKEDEYNKLANLVLINLNNIKSGAKEFELEDIYDSGKKLKIKLDEKLSPTKNADKYFEKAKDNKINYKKSKDIYSNSKDEFNKLKSYQKELENDLTGERINQIMKELKLKTEHSSIVKDDISIKI